MDRWLLKSWTVIAAVSVTVGLIIGVSVGPYYGMAFLMNRSTQVHVSRDFAMAKFPISPLRQGILSRGGTTSDNVEVIDTTSWITAFGAKIPTDDKELSGVREYRVCEWRWIVMEFRSITTCIDKRGPLPAELREAIQKGRELLATVYPPREP